MRTSNEFTTEVSGIEYPVRVQLYDSVTEALEELGEDGVLNVVNAKRKQDSVQGPKGAVRKVIEAGHGADSPELAEAIREAQEATLNYRFGRGGGGGRAGGPTKKAQAEFGQAVTAAMATKGGALSAKELAELAAEYGVA
jgi:hypothetical protein